MAALREKIEQIIIRSKDDPSLSQAVARITIAMLFLALSALLYDDPEYTTMPIISSLYFLYAIGSLYLEYRDPQKSLARKVTNMVADFGAQSIFLYTSGQGAMFVYPFMLWVIIGNGLRFGPKYLYIALTISVTFFGLATQLNPVWHQHQDFIIAMTTGLVVLTIFYATLIKKIYQLNATLEKRVKERTAQLKYRLYHDQLTKLRNRTALQSDLGKEPFVALFLIDIDNFGNYNDLYGMEVGNRILLESKQFLEDLFADQDSVLYRIYGDGFALRVRSETLLPQVEARLKEHTYFTLTLPEIDEKLTIDFTIVAVAQKERALEKADMGLKYARKRKVRFVTYSDEMCHTKEIQNRLLWKDRIKDAIAEDRVIPVFQPIVDRNGHIFKYEALMRLDQEQKLISPYFFLEIAHQTNQYEKLTDIMVEKSFSYMRETGQDLSINLTFSDIQNQRFVDSLYHKIQKERIGPQLTVEILESEDINDLVLIQTFVKNLKRLGVEVAIDDFGSGFSNFTHILKIEPDYLKIDGSLIKDIDTDEKSRKLVESIVFMSHRLGIRTVAEYVHSKEVFEIAKNLNVDAFQGFYFSEPLRSEALKDVITAQTRSR